MGSRQQQARITVTVDGVNLGVWDDRTGGDTDSTTTQYQLGGMGPNISLGGSQVVTNVVVMKLIDNDLLSRQKWLAGRAGKGQMTVTEVALDDEGQTIGEPMVWKGVLKRSKPPDRNSNSATAAQHELELDVSGPIG